MNDCPLAINATAVTAKNNSNSPVRSGYASNAALPPPEKDGEHFRNMSLHRSRRIVVQLIFAAAFS